MPPVREVSPVWGHRLSLNYLLMLPLTFCRNPLMPNDLQRRHRHWVDVWRNFVHSCPINCCGLLRRRTLEGQDFFMVPECTPSTNLIYNVNTQLLQILSQLSNTFQTLLALFIAATWAHWGGWNINTGLCSKLCWPERLSVDYCTHITDKTNAQNLEISIKIDVYNYRRATDIPIVVLG